MYKKQNSGLIEAISHTAGQHNKGFVRPVLTEMSSMYHQGTYWLKCGKLFSKCAGKKTSPDPFPYHNRFRITSTGNL